MRVKRIGLEHHGDIAILWRHVIDDTLANFDLPSRDFLQPGDHPQKRGLAAAGGADENDELAVGD